MKQTISGLAAVVASLWAGCTPAPTDSTVKSVAPAYIGFGNWLGNGCPVYGSNDDTSISYNPYDFTLTDADIWLTEGNPLRVLKISADRILAERRLRYPIEGSNDILKAKFDIKRQLVLFNPKFYADYHHQFKAGETIYYPSYRGNGTGGTLNCTL